MMIFFSREIMAQLKTDLFLELYYYLPIFQKKSHIRRYNHSKFHDLMRTNCIKTRNFHKSFKTPIHSSNFE